MQNLFMDESGTLAFSEVSNRFFVLAFIAPKSGKVLNKFVKNFNAHLFRKGWNPDVEIKASNLWNAAKNQEIGEDYAYKNSPQIPVAYFFDGLAKLDFYVEYVVVKLDTIKPSLRAQPKPILYNFFAWQLLKGPLTFFPDVSLYCDRRNREYHTLLKFDGYIEGQAAVERANKDKPKLNLVIHHYHGWSAQEVSGPARAAVEFGVRGIQAADFVCWAVRAKFENGINDWLARFEKAVKWKQFLYFDEPK